jgi:hypothetical protein
LSSVPAVLTPCRCTQNDGRVGQVPQGAGRTATPKHAVEETAVNYPTTTPSLFGSIALPRLMRNDLGKHVLCSDYLASFEQL